MLEQSVIIVCVPGYVHREREVKGGEGCHSVGSICPACSADLKFYEVSLEGYITAKDRIRIAKQREQEASDLLRKKVSV